MSAYNVMIWNFDLVVKELSALESMHMYVSEEAGDRPIFYFFDRDGEAQHYDDWKECAAAITLVWS